MCMKQIKKAISAFLATALLAAMLPGTALAESRTKIGKVNLEVHSRIRIGDSSEDVTVTTDNGYCFVDGVEVTNSDGDDWSRSKPPIIEITLSADSDDYYFNSTSKSNYKMKMYGGSYEDIKVLDVRYESGSDKTVVIVKARFVYDKDNDTGSVAAPTNVDWSTSHDGFGYWEEAPEAKYYQVQLLKNGSVTGSTYSAQNPQYQFAGMITESGSYRFRVRSVETGTNSKSDWVTSGTWSISAEEAAQLVSKSGSWQKAADGVRSWWRYNDGSYPAYQWLPINGSWYYFDAEGYMCTGWLELNGTYYYLDPATGAMWANQRTPDGYWVNGDGVYVPGQ